MTRASRSARRRSGGRRRAARSAGVGRGRQAADAPPAETGHRQPRLHRRPSAADRGAPPGGDLLPGPRGAARRRSHWADAAHESSQTARVRHGRQSRRPAARADQLVPGALSGAPTVQCGGALCPAVASTAGSAPVRRHGLLLWLGRVDRGRPPRRHGHSGPQRERGGPRWRSSGTNAQADAERSVAGDQPGRRLDGHVRFDGRRARRAPREQGPVVARLDLQGAATDIAVDGERVWIAAGSGEVVGADARSGRIVHRLHLRSALGAETAPVLSSDGRSVVSRTPYDSLRGAVVAHALPSGRR